MTHGSLTSPSSKVRKHVYQFLPHFYIKHVYLFPHPCILSTSISLHSDQPAGRALPVRRPHRDVLTRCLRRIRARRGPSSMPGVWLRSLAGTVDGFCRHEPFLFASALRGGGGNGWEVPTEAPEAAWPWPRSCISEGRR